ncbi:MAG: phosphoribosyl-ATP diphosphatase [Oscillospiraceae bacterium]|nr:phosphoribosyl-ATP diphosphatase [Oscillospiraceae bacterium]
MNDTIIQLYNTILQRKAGDGDEKSYTRYLFEQGLNKILKKLGEECTETVIAAKEDNQAELVNELADLTYHMLVLMACKDVTIEALYTELDSRAAKMGNLKEMNKKGAL